LARPKVAFHPTFVEMHAFCALCSPKRSEPLRTSFFPPLCFWLPQASEPPVSCDQLPVTVPEFRNSHASSPCPGLFGLWLLLDFPYYLITQGHPSFASLNVRMHIQRDVCSNNIYTTYSTHVNRSPRPTLHATRDSEPSPIPTTRMRRQHRCNETRTKAKKDIRNDEGSGAKREKPECVSCTKSSASRTMRK